ncbi:MAG: B12-binding domain-containing radical SAM protein [Bacteroidales bacterium]|nr:B12-binding domain-containing radical SAM protein [Bacteroidales bacterium]MCF8336435.1 B12-binding domain-containing radical SAM protein [Bacteroidales bacterium]
MAKKYKLLLINPQNQHRIGFALTVTSRYPPISLGIIAALTPDSWEVEILDENFDRFEDNPDKEADLVGITAFTPNVFRAYQIAEHYKSRDIPVVLGGIHATMMPGEATQYVDVVFKGEAESKWPDLIKDFENNNLQPVYEGGRPPMEKIPTARHDLFHKDYLFNSIQTTRGCPYKCDFCSVHRFNGNKHRLRPVQDILDEMEQLPDKLLGIVDDNFYGYSIRSREHSYAILEGMIERGLKKQWFIQASMNIAEDPRFLKLASKAGCREVLLGVESDNLDQLKQSNKFLNAKMKPESFKKKFRKIQRAGISVLGAFIFGLDGDTPESLHRRERFIKKSGVDAIQATVLTPNPGTELFEKLTRENRVIRNNYPEDWQRYHAEEVVIQPDRMSAEELEHHMYIIWHKIYNKTTMRKNVIKSVMRSRKLKSAIWAYVGNWHYRRIVFENGGYDPDKHPDKQERIFRVAARHEKK